MGAHAVGAYLRVVREARGIGRYALAQKIGVSASQIELLEKAVHTPRGPFLFAVVREVQGNLDDVEHLLLDPDVTVEAGEQLAREWVAQQRQQPAQSALWQQAQEIFAQVKYDPYILERLIGYAERLLDEEPAAATESGGLPDQSDPQGEGSHTGEEHPG